MTCVVSFDFQGVVDHQGLVKIYGDNFLYAVFDVLRGEEVRFSLTFHHNLAHVFEENRRDGFGGMSHVNGTFVANHFRHEGECTDVIQMKVGNDDAVEILV